MTNRQWYATLAHDATKRTLRLLDVAAMWQRMGLRDDYLRCLRLAESEIVYAMTLRDKALMI